MKTMTLLPSMIGALFLAMLAGCAKEEPAPPGQNPASMSKVELSARFPYDLGPSTVDVSKYPKNIREEYKVFLAVCSACHTPARPLNSPMTSPADWTRFVHRMHVKSQDRGFSLDPEDEKKIVDFLVYDSRVRKIDRKREFNARQEALKTIYQQVTKERDRLTLEETKRLPKKETPYVGVK